MSSLANYSAPLSDSRVFVHIVTYNNEATIAQCIASVLNTVGFVNPVTLLVTDNASSDQTREILSTFVGRRIQICSNNTNLGFCKAHNQGFSKALVEKYDFVFILNPDATLLPDTLLTLVNRLKNDSLAGFASPKLLRVANLEPAQFEASRLSQPYIDSAGMVITRSLRHFDRGSNQPDHGQFEAEEYVFGATGAACLFKREFLLDVALESNSEEAIEVFDSAFFAYREDADLSFRAAWLGWRCLYTPQAIVYHVRKVLPENRASLPSLLNAYSVRNRFLLQMNNYTPLVSLSSYPFIHFRNLVVRAAVILKERSSLPALRSVKFLERRANAHLSQLKRRRRVTWSSLGNFFDEKKKPTRPLLPNSLPLHPLSKPAQTKPRDVIAVIVNFNSGKRLLSCMTALLKDIARLSNIQLRILAWDNSSVDQSFDLAQSELQHHPSCIFRKSKKNLGFAGAINSAFSEYSADAILILNPDVYLSALDVEKLSNTLEQYAQLGLVAPILQNSDSSPQLGFSVKALPTLASLTCDLLGLKHLWPSNPWSENYYQTGNQILNSYLKRKVNKLIPHLSLDEPFVVEQPAGAALLVRKSAFDSVGGFDTQFFPAWFEDVDFCKRLQEKGWQLAVLGSAQAIHEGGYSALNLGADMFADAWYTNLRRYARKHFSIKDRLILGFAITLALLLRSGHSLFSTKLKSVRERLKVSLKLLALIGKVRA